ncbi:MAG: thermonuclease family protein [Betaproteobacteria bacterium]|nr:thermonuclease family protein [Betaproteobacteria bacterium]
MTRRWPGLRRHPDGGLTVRLDGIDAPETHYLASGGLGVLRQPSPWPDRAAAALLEFLGFQRVGRHSDERVVSAEPPAVAGAIALRRADKYGRAVAFAFRGRFRISSSQRFALTAPVVRSSANWHLLTQGLAYPVFYQDMPQPLLELMGRAGHEARAAGLGLWPHDRSHDGFTLASLDALQREALLWPKLFRRLVDHVGGNGGQLSLAAFGAYLESEVGVVRLWQAGCDAAFTSLVSVEQASVRLLVPPEAIAFAED